MHWLPQYNWNTVENSVKSTIKWLNGFLTPYRKILTFNDPEEDMEDLLRKHCGNQHFLLSHNVFSTLPKTNQNTWVEYILPSANAFNLVKSNFCRLVKGYVTFNIIHCNSSHIYVFPCLALGKGSKVSCPKILPRKIKRTQWGLNLGTPGHKSYAIPLNNEGPTMKPHSNLSPFTKRQNLGFELIESICRWQIQCC